MCVLASTTVPFRPTTVQMLNLALIDMTHITVQLAITSCEESNAVFIIRKISSIRRLGLEKGLSHEISLIFEGL